MIEIDYTKKACDFIKSCAPVVVTGFPYRTPYLNKSDSPYITFTRKRNSLEEGYEVIYDSVELAFQDLCQDIKNYVGNNKRVIVRIWPEIFKIERTSKSFFEVYCRLIADDGTKELKMLDATKVK